jgi:splicing factor 3A subunit 3
MQDTPLEKLDKKHFAKGARASEENRAAATLELDHNSKEIALIEAKMKKLCELLDEVSLCSIITKSYHMFEL